MKLRIEGNSIRLRVKKSDLNRLNTEGVVHEMVSFMKGFNFHYELKTHEKASNIDAVFTHSTITISIPLSIANAWINSETVGLENTLENGLFILIEKDFPCKTRENEDKNDTFQELMENDEPVIC
jgi:hypothetical protein